MAAAAVSEEARAGGRGSGPAAWWRLVAALALGLCGVGCTLVQLRGEAREFQAATVLAGRVSPPQGWSGPVVVAALAEAAPLAVRGRLVHQVWLHEPGGFELIVPDGRYTLLAWGDVNGNGRPDADEPGAQLPLPVEVSGQGMVLQLDMALAAGAAGAVRAALPADAPSAPRHSTQAGALADLAAPAFSADAGRQGYWSPLESFRRSGGNVYFTEPYDPSRTPVLFVHGAAGSAQDWAPFLARLDRRRYQAWLFQYPSGAALDSMAHLLYWKLLNLQVRHGFTRLHLVAHSMGGLVVRRMLLDHGAEMQPWLGAFVSLSTPWGGEASAALGVQHSPAVVPSWRDMQPEGPFLAALFQRPLPPGLPHLLLFGHRGGLNLLRPNHDGSVTLASQLRPEAQAGARRVIGYDEDHTSIQAAPAVIDQVQALLAAAGADRSLPPGGRVRLQARLPDGAALPPGVLPVLALWPLEAGASAPAGPFTEPVLLPLGDAAGEPLSGPVPPGRYLAALAAPAYRSRPARQPLTLEAGGVGLLQVELAPQGSLYGYVGAEGDALARPAGAWRPPHEQPRLRRIHLQGPGVDRTLVPRRDGPVQLLDAYLADQDDAVGAHFNFVGLPAGDYQLTVEAEGHAAHVSRHRVVPGRPTPFAPLVLKPAGPSAQ